MEERLLDVLLNIHFELERIAKAVEDLVEVQQTEPLEKIIHPSSTRETFPTGEQT